MTRAHIIHEIQRTAKEESSMSLPRRRSSAFFALCMGSFVFLFSGCTINRPLHLPLGSLQVTMECYEVWPLPNVLLYQSCSLPLESAKEIAAYPARWGMPPAKENGMVQ